MKPRLLFHCHHTLGLGHLIRSLRLAQSFADRFDVVLLAGGELPENLELPRGLEVVPLAGLGGERPARVMKTFRRARPDVVVVELFPFGRKKLASELLPMLEAASASGARVVCSVRDILVRGRGDQERHDERAAEIVNRLFDAVLVHADPRFVRLEDTFRPRTPLRVPVHYTGFVAPADGVEPARGPRTGPLVVSVGGGRFGAPLLRAAAAAQPAILARTGLSMRLVAGPFLPDDEWRGIARATRGQEGLDLVRAVPDLAAELAGASVSLSQCGYNTALDVIRSRVPALVVPFAAPGEDEQKRRAELLEGLGAVRIVVETELAPARLPALVEAAIDRPPVHVRLDLDGAPRSCDLLFELVATPRLRRTRSWLDPVRASLDEAPEPVAFFFRDDDAGWGDERLLLLLDVFDDAGVEVDVAAIPAALSPELAELLLARGFVHVHQHGFAHANHEVAGRKCEFGPSRPAHLQRADIVGGQRLLREQLGEAVEPFFTPPWNRCTAVTARAVREAGLAVLSRESRAEPFDLDGLRELPVSVDWVRPATRAELGEMLAGAARTGGPVGVMLHHAVMDGEQRRGVAELLRMLQAAPSTRLATMAELAQRSVVRA
jgi:predicted glycosyltransferase